MSAAASSFLSPMTPPLEDGFGSVLASQLARLTRVPVHASTEGDAEVEPVDIDRLLEMVDDDPTQLRDVVNMYLNESNRGIGELWASIQAGDWDQSERLAHRLGGTASMCGMVGLVAPLRAIEVAAQAGRWSRIQLLMLEARVQQGRVLASLEKHGLKREQGR